MKKQPTNVTLQKLHKNILYLYGCFHAKSTWLRDVTELRNLQVGYCLIRKRFTHLCLRGWTSTTMWNFDFEPNPVLRVSGFIQFISVSCQDDAFEAVLTNLTVCGIIYWRGWMKPIVDSWERDGSGWRPAWFK